MRSNIGSLMLGLFAMSAFSWAQAQPSASAQSPSSPPQAQQLSFEFLANVLRSASTFHDGFHDMVKSMNIQGNLSPAHAVNPDGTSAVVRPIDRTAAMLGAGAGAGAAIGELSGTQKGLMIGIVAGAAGALVIDQVLRHREEKPQDSPDSPHATNRDSLDRLAPAPQIHQ